MTATGGSMYHDSGYAGLREESHPRAGLVDQQVNIASGWQGEVLYCVDQPLVERPLSVSSSLFLK